MKTLEKIIENLRAAATELEELRVQAALGKAEARDKYEQVHKKFSMSLGEAKKVAEKKYEELKLTLEALELQFVLGSAIKQNFKNQGQKFSSLMDELETFLGRK